MGLIWMPTIVTENSKATTVKTACYLLQFSTSHLKKKKKIKKVLSLGIRLA